MKIRISVRTCRRVAFCCLAVVFAGPISPLLYAQNVSVSAPTTRINNTNQPSNAFSLNGSVGGFGFNLSGGQSSNRSIVSQSPTVTVANGGTGTFIDTTQRPFVMGYTPVVGGFHATYPGMYAPPTQPNLVYPIQQALQRMAAGDIPPPTDSAQIDQLGSSAMEGNVDALTERPLTPSNQVASTASQPDISVAAIRRKQAAIAAANEAGIAEFITKADAAESRGDLRTAVKWLDQARRNSTGAQRKKFESRIRNLRSQLRTSPST